jgi:hypothetical protein
MTNVNLPPIEVCVDNYFILENQKEGVSWGHLIAARALQNQAIQFTVLLSTGVLYTGLPLHAIGTNPNRKRRPLSEVLFWDNISSSIEVLTLDTIRYTPCTVLSTNKEMIKGEYLFTIDYVGNNDLSRSAEHWKQTHVIAAEDGDLLIYPQYRLRFFDPALCWDSGKPMRDYKYNDINWSVGR